MKRTEADFPTGISQVRFYRALNHGRPKTQHTFLSLRQPPDEMKVPTPRISKKDSSTGFHSALSFPRNCRLDPAVTLHKVNTLKIRIESFRQHLEIAAAL